MTKLYYIIIFMVWLIGLFLGFLISYYLDGRLRKHKKMGTPILPKMRNSDVFAGQVIEKARNGEFKHLTIEDIFTINGHVFSELEVHRRLCNMVDKDQRDDPEFMALRNIIFNMYADFSSYKLVFKTEYLITVNCSSLSDTENRKYVLGNTNSITAQKIQRIPCCTYKYKIYKDDKPQNLYMNIADIPGEGFRVVTFMLIAHYMDWRRFYVGTKEDA